jgi:hypothetical protein
MDPANALRGLQSPDHITELHRASPFRHSHPRRKRSLRAAGGSFRVTVRWVTPDDGRVDQFKRRGRSQIVTDSKNKRRHANRALHPRSQPIFGTEKNPAPSGPKCPQRSARATKKPPWIPVPPFTTLRTSAAFRFVARLWSPTVVPYLCLISSVHVGRTTRCLQTNLFGAMLDSTNSVVPLILFKNLPQSPGPDYCKR